MCYPFQSSEDQFDGRRAMVRNLLIIHMRKAIAIIVLLTALYPLFVVGGSLTFVIFGNLRLSHLPLWFVLDVVAIFYVLVAGIGLLRRWPYSRTLAGLVFLFLVGLVLVNFPWRAWSIPPTQTLGTVALVAILLLPVISLFRDWFAEDRAPDAGEGGFQSEREGGV